jgi:hypothetical protein
MLSWVRSVEKGFDDLKTNKNAFQTCFDNQVTLLTELIMMVRDPKL